MLLCYNWGHSVGHVYSHVTWTEAECCGNHASTSTKTHNPISDLGDFKPDVDSGDQARASDASDNLEVSNNDSNDTGPDNSTTDHSEGVESELESEEEALIISYLDSDSIHPAINVLEYDDYRY